MEQRKKRKKRRIEFDDDDENSEDEKFRIYQKNLPEKSTHWKAKNNENIKTFDEVFKDLGVISTQSTQQNNNQLNELPNYSNISTDDGTDSDIIILKKNKRKKKRKKKERPRPKKKRKLNKENKKSNKKFNLLSLNETQITTILLFLSIKTICSIVVKLNKYLSSISNSDIFWSVLKNINKIQCISIKFNDDDNKQFKRGLLYYLSCNKSNKKFKYFKNIPKIKLLHKYRPNMGTSLDGYIQIKLYLIRELALYNYIKRNKKIKKNFNLKIYDVNINIINDEKHKGKKEFLIYEGIDINKKYEQYKKFLFGKWNLKQPMKFIKKAYQISNQCYIEENLHKKIENELNNLSIIPNIMECYNKLLNNESNLISSMIKPIEIETIKKEKKKFFYIN